MEVYLIRHTPTVAQEGVCYGQSDLELQHPFLPAFEQIKKATPSEEFIIFSSPLKRCAELAQYLAGEQTIQTDNRLMEIDFGQWENLAWNDIKKETLDSWMEDFVHIGPPGGENFIRFYERVSNFIQELISTQEKNAKVLIVTHAGVIRCFMCYLLNIPLVDAFKTPAAFGSITKMELYNDHSWNKLVYLNKL